jgi:hypothetical protein
VTQELLLGSLFFTSRDLQGPFASRFTVAKDVSLALRRANSEIHRLRFVPAILNFRDLVVLVTQHELARALVGFETGIASHVERQGYTKILAV